MPKSPLNTSRLARGPGDSLLRQLFGEHFLKPVSALIGLTFAGGMLCGVFIAWLVTLLPGRLPVNVALIVTGIFLAAATIRAKLRWPAWLQQIDNSLKGRAGEAAAAAILAELGKDGYIIAHDIPLHALDPSIPDGPNIDHLLIGPGGVFVVETKYIAKADSTSGASNTVTFDQAQRRLLFNGQPKDRCALTQARNNAATVAAFLKRTQPDLQVPVTPVVLIPGWMVNIPASLDVAVLNPKRIFNLVRPLPKPLDARAVGNLYESLSPHLTREDSTSDLFN